MLLTFLADQDRKESIGLPSYSSIPVSPAWSVAAHPSLWHR